ncbi:hypothetical protein F2Q70_00000678 [Brassica cretica]|uniref:Uncharacterized protein n=1 Tax=Brassica cretica TaxID=69181 RepID=A0A8S9IRK4_BRACR|nr:hypothetical protein F2Q70_00000678 [Brassica cretica]
MWCLYYLWLSWFYCFADNAYGFMFLVTSSLLGYIYSPQLDSPPPRWVHFAHGSLLFLYQTFDAVDGKQARRTNSSSPLGELFDHGSISGSVSDLLLRGESEIGRHRVVTLRAVSSRLVFLCIFKSLARQALPCLPP